MIAASRSLFAVWGPGNDGAYERRLIKPVLSKNGSLGIMVVHQRFDSPGLEHGILELIRTGRVEVVDTDDGDYTLRDSHGTMANPIDPAYVACVANVIAFTKKFEQPVANCSVVDSYIQWDYIIEDDDDD